MRIWGIEFTGSCSCITWIHAFDGVNSGIKKSLLHPRVKRAFFKPPWIHELVFHAVVEVQIQFIARILFLTLRSAAKQGS